MPTLCLYVVLQLPIVLSDNIAVILVFRFVTGVLASPTQAQGGGSVSDMWRSQKLGYPMMIYDHGKYCRRTNSVQPHSANISLAAAMGTFFGPVVGNFAAEYRDYTWPIWISIWFSGFSLIVLLFLLPETSPDHILYQKARRLRETTANNKFTTQAEQDSQNTTTKDIVRKVFIKPLALNFQGPIVLVLNLYLALIYALLFAALESYKLIFVGIYGFSSGEESLTFIAVLLSFQFGVALYFLFLYYYQEKKFTADGKLPPEQRLIPSFVTAFTVPIGLFWYGWSARTSIHWIMPVIGGSFVGISAAGIFSSILSYLPEAYPSVASTVLAGTS